MMLKDRIASDFMEAYKAKEFTKKNFLGVIKGTIQNNEGKLIESTDENVLKVLKQFEKGLNETIEAKVKLNQDTTEARQELDWLSVYLPKQMSEEEITNIISEILSREGINKNKGVLIGLFNKEQKGKAFDNKLVSKIIQERL